MIHYRRGVHVNISSALLYSLMIGSLVLQGCAATSSTRSDAAPAAGVPAQTAASAASGSKLAGATVPESDGKPVIAADTKDNFDAVAAAIRQEMQSGGRFAFVSKTGRQTVDTKLSDMGNLFSQYGSVQKMDPAAQKRLLGDQNSINEVLARYDNNRRVCWQETPVGTHFPKTVCRTLGQIQNERENSKQNLDQTRRLMQQQSQIMNSPAPNGGH